MIKAQICYLKNPEFPCVKSITDVKDKKSSEDHIHPIDLNDFKKKKVYFAKSNCSSECTSIQHDHEEFSECYILKLIEISENLIGQKRSNRIRKPKIIEDLGSLSPINKSIPAVKKGASKNKLKNDQAFGRSASVLKALNQCENNSNGNHQLLCSFKSSIKNLRINLEQLDGKGNIKNTITKEKLLPFNQKIIATNPEMLPKLPFSVNVGIENNSQSQEIITVTPDINFGDIALPVTHSSYTNSQEILPVEINRKDVMRSKSYSEKSNNSSNMLNQFRSEIRDKSQLRANENSNSRIRDREPSHIRDNFHSRTSDQSPSRSREMSPPSRFQSKSHSTNGDKSLCKPYDKSHSRRRNKSPCRSRDRSRSKTREKSQSSTFSRSHSQTRNRSHSRAQEKLQSKSRNRSLSQTRDRSRSRAHDKSQSRSRNRSRSQTRSRSRSRAHEKSQFRSRNWSRSQTRDRSRSRAHDKSQSRSRSRTRDRSHSRSRDSGRNERSKNIERYYQRLHGGIDNNENDDPQELNTEYEKSIERLQRIFYNESSDPDNDFKGRGETREFIIASIEYYILTNEGRQDKEKRYSHNSNTNQIYLGEGIMVSSVSWLFLQNLNHEEFIRQTAILIWGKPEILANRALQLSRVTFQLPDRSPIKRIEKEKLRLLISLLDDYMDKKLNKSSEEKISSMISVTLTLLTKIRDCKAAIIKAHNRRIARQRDYVEARRRLY